MLDADSVKSTLTNLKCSDYTPEVILDIGANKGDWTRMCLDVFPGASYYLFEAEHHTELDSFAAHNNVTVYANCLLYRENIEIDWFATPEHDGQGNSIYKENTKYFEYCKSVKRKTSTLNNYVKENIALREAKNILIKIDTQGSELDILTGASALLEKTDFILLELPFVGVYNCGAPRFADYIKYMDSIGFVPYELINQTCTLVHNINIQCDMLFVNKNNRSIITQIDRKISEKAFNQNITVITYSTGYSYEVFSRFADSLYSTGFSGNLVFIIKEQDLANLHRLMLKYEKVSFFLDKSDNPRHCQQKRYYLYRELLESIKTDYVFLADSRDLFFQRNIELWPVDPLVDVYFVSEGNKIGNCIHNTGWLRDIDKDLNEDIVHKLKDCPIICSGTTYGKLDGIKAYVEGMCTLMSTRVHADYRALDQGMHNYMIHTGKFENLKTCILHHNDPFVGTLTYGNRFMNAASQLVNTNMVPLYIVHQWDRLPDYMQERLPFKV